MHNHTPYDSICFCLLTICSDGTEVVVKVFAKNDQYAPVDQYEKRLQGELVRVELWKGSYCKQKEIIISIHNCTMLMQKKREWSFPKTQPIFPILITVFNIVST